MVAVPPTKEEIEAVTLETAVERIARLSEQDTTLLV